MHNSDMSPLSLLAFSKQNRRLIFIMLCCHLTWGALVMMLWSFGNLFQPVSSIWAGIFAALQLYAAAQLILPALLLHPEERSRGFYLFWGGLLALASCKRQPAKLSSPSPP